MKIKDVLQENSKTEIYNHRVIGIDIGSRQAKAVLLDGDDLFTTLIPTGFIMKDTANELLSNLYAQSGYQQKDIEYIVVTGYGRVALSFEDVPYRPVTEIACHGRGAHFLGNNIKTIIDIGGQDSKVIRIDPSDGKVIDFAMNDKCAAGTGRFLEKISAVLGYDVTEVGPASLEAEVVTPINSTCVVFAESEVVAARAKGTPATDLAAGIHHSVAKRVRGLLSKVGIEQNVLFTGGVSNNVGMRKAFEDILGFSIESSKLNTVFAGALGAAVYAADYAHRGLPAIAKRSDEIDFELDLESYRQEISRAYENFIHRSAGKKAYVAYTCNYTPLEILGAADVAFHRMIHRGTPEEIIAGETLTASMVCDFTKSVMGAFIKEAPETKAMDKLYTFYSCACMKNVVEAIGNKYVPTGIYNVPRRRKEEDAPAFLAAEIEAFKKDLEKLTNETISEEAIRESIRKYNKAKRQILEIAEYRKGEYPIVSSHDFQEIISGYYSLPIDTLLEELQKIRTQLKAAKRENGTKKIRLMLSGGVIADGDHKITHILEKELGAAIVVEDNCTGIKPIDFQIAEDQTDVYTNLANAYLGKAPCARMFGIQDMVEYSVNLAKEYQVDGVVFYYLKFCTCYSMVEKVYTEAFREAGIPFIILSGDYSVGDEGQFKTRLEAFTEMIAEGKDSKNV
ncbi:MAG: 2-hydroxyacyl-CoA dehydratase [Agathobacter sp.]